MRFTTSLVPLLGSLLLAGSASAQGSDLCSSATPISGAGTFNFDNTSAATDGAGDPACHKYTRDNMDHDVWFAWTAPSSQTYTVTTCSGTYFIDTKVAVHDGGCGSSVLACNDDYCGLQSTVTFLATAGNSYRIRLGTFPGAAGGTGTFSLFPGDPGTASCFGIGCPCNNDDPTAGCANSTGPGALLTGNGTSRVSVDDLVLNASQLPLGQQALFYMGDGIISAHLNDGLQCALGANNYRFLNSNQSSGSTGTVSHSGFAADAPALIVPGSTWHFHCWYRDVSGSPCGTGANLSNLYSVTFVP